MGLLQVLIYEARSNGITNEACNVIDVELLHNPSSVVLRCPRTDVEHAANFTARVTLSEESQNFPLPVSQYFGLSR